MLKMDSNDEIGEREKGETGRKLKWRERERARQGRDLPRFFVVARLGREKRERQGGKWRVRVVLVGRNMVSNDETRERQVLTCKKGQILKLPLNLINLRP